MPLIIDLLQELLGTVPTGHEEWEYIFGGIFFMFSLFFIGGLILKIIKR